MTDSITWVGIDDHKKSLTVAVLGGSGEGPPELRTFANEDKALRRFVRRLEKQAKGGEIRICYEAGPNGFSLRRRLESMGHVVVDVIAPTLTPRRSGSRVKTDSRDAVKLVRLYRAGELTSIAMPEASDEAARDVVRTHSQIKQEILRKKHHILKLLTRRGRLYNEGSNWTLKHRKWLQEQRWDTSFDEIVFEELMAGLNELEERRLRLELAMQQLAEQECRAPIVDALRCFQGIDTSAAVALAVEIFDIQRFESPRRLMSYLGLTSGIDQSGEKERRGGITKAGNRFARFTLGQVAWHYRQQPRPGVRLRKRREGKPIWAIAIADRAHRRLHRRYWRLTNRGKSSQKAVTAVARELVGFVWEAMTEAHARREQNTAVSLAK